MTQGYSDDFARKHEERMEAERKEKAAMKAANDAARAEYLKGLEDKRVAERVIHEDRIVATFESRKQHAKRQWLYDNANKTPDDFECQAWPLVRENWLLDADPGIEAWRAREAARQQQVPYERGADFDERVAHMVAEGLARTEPWRG